LPLGVTPPELWKRSDQVPRFSYSRDSSAASEFDRIREFRFPCHEDGIANRPAIRQPDDFARRLKRRDRRHFAVMRLTAQPSQEHADEHLGVEPIRLGPTAGCRFSLITSR
jgi:hypothetical protein